MNPHSQRTPIQGLSDLFIKLGYKDAVALYSGVEMLIIARDEQRSGPEGDAQPKGNAAGVWLPLSFDENRVLVDANRQPVTIKELHDAFLQLKREFNDPPARASSEAGPARNSTHGLTISAGTATTELSNTQHWNKDEVTVTSHPQPEAGKDVAMERDAWRNLVLAPYYKLDALNCQNCVAAAYAAVERQCATAHSGETDGK